MFDIEESDFESEQYYEPSSEEWAHMAEESKKWSINTFEQYYENVVDQKIEESIVALRQSHRRQTEEYSKLIQNFQTPKTEREHIDQQVEKHFASRFYDENLKIAFALYELKILYAYKYFEIKLHELAHIAFEEWQNPHYWKTVKKDFSKKGISIETLQNYASLNELRNVNNALKHRGKCITEEIEDIEEFYGLKVIGVSQLKAFYERVKDAPYNFISELSTVIYNTLWPNEKSKIIEGDFDLADGLEIDL
jgi:hypothetical protein